MVLHEYGDNEHRNTLEYQSNRVTWCMKDSALSTGLTEDKINYEHNVQYVQYQIHHYEVCEVNYVPFNVCFHTTCCPFNHTDISHILHTINYNVL